MGLHLDFEGAKNIHVLYVLIWGFVGQWRFLTGVWHLDLDLDKFSGLRYTNVLNFDSVLILKVPRTSMSFKFSFGALENAGSYGWGFCMF